MPQELTVVKSEPLTVTSSTEDSGDALSIVKAEPLSVVSAQPDSPTKSTSDRQRSPYELAGLATSTPKMQDAARSVLGAFDPVGSLKQITDAKKEFRQAQRDGAGRSAALAHGAEGVMRLASGPGLVLGAMAPVATGAAIVGSLTGEKLFQGIAKRLGVTQGKQELAGVVGSLAGGGLAAKGAGGLVEGLRSTAEGTAASEAALAKAREADTHARQTFDAKLTTSAAKSLAEQRRASLGQQALAHATADQLRIISSEPLSTSRALPAAGDSTFHVELPLGMVSAPESVIKATPAERIEIAKAIQPKDVEVITPEGGDLAIVQAQTPHGMISTTLPIETLEDARAASRASVEALRQTAKAAADRPRPKTFAELTPLEKQEVRRIAAELDEFKFRKAERPGRPDETASQAFNYRARGAQGKASAAARQGDRPTQLWSPWRPGAPVYHDIMAGVSGTRDQVLTAAQRWIAGTGRRTATVDRLIQVARRRLAGDPDLKQASLPPEAGFKADDFPDFAAQLAREQRFAEAPDTFDYPPSWDLPDEDGFGKAAGAETITQFLGTSAEQAAQGTTMGVLRRTPREAVPVLEGLQRLKGDTKAWGRLSPEVQHAVNSQVVYLEAMIPQELAKVWAKEGKPGLTIRPRENAKVLAENPVATDVLPEPGTVGRAPEAAEGSPNGQERPGEAASAGKGPTSPDGPNAPGGGGGGAGPATPEAPKKVMKDLRGIRTQIGPVEATLQSIPETKPIIDLLLDGADREPQFVAKYTARFAETHRGLSKAEMYEYSDVLNEFADPNEAFGKMSTRLKRPYSSAAVQAAIRARGVTSEIFSQFPGNATIRGTLPQFISHYLTHLERISADSPDLLAGIKQSWDHWYGGLMDDFREVFVRRDVPLTDEQGASIPPRPLGAGKPRSRFVEHRTGKITHLELDPRVIWPIYVKSAARVIIDKGIVDQARTLAENLPDPSKARELATQVIRNYSRYDALPELHRAWQASMRLMNQAFVRSVLGLSPRLALLHLARIQGVYAEMPNRYFWGSGLKETLKNPVKAFQRTSQAGLLPNNLLPPEYRPLSTKLDNVLNFMGVVDFFDRSVALHGFEKMYRDQGMSPSAAYRAAVSQTKKTVQFTDRARYTFPMGQDSEIGRAAFMFKAIPTRIVAQMVETARQAKTDPARFARHAGIVSALLAVEANTGLHLIHVGASLLRFEPPVASESWKVVSALYKGDWKTALGEVALLLTPAGKSIATTAKGLVKQTERALGYAPPPLGQDVQ